MNSRDMSLSEYNRLQKKRKIKAIIFGIVALVAAVFMFIIGDFGVYFGIAFVCIGLILFIISSKLIKTVTEAERKANEEKLDQIMDKYQSQAVDPETRKKLRLADMAYKRGEITLMQYEAYKSKLTGEEFIPTKVGMTSDQIMHEQAKEVKEIKMEQAQKQAEKTVAMHAIVGGALGGTTGAVVGAAVGKQKAENDLQKAEESL